VLIVPDLLAFGVARVPGRPCVVAGDRAHTFREASERASRLADALQRQGIRRGDRVAVLAQNELEYTELQVGACRAGAILAPLNWRLTVPELRFMVENSTPSLLIHGPGYAATARELGLPTWHLGESGHGEPYEEQLAAADASAPVPALRAEDAAQIIYTSGTTGRPKGAILSNHALWSRCNTLALEYHAHSGHVYVGGLPMFHMAAHPNWAFTYVGATTVMIRAFEPQQMLEAVERFRGTHLMLVPTMITMLLEHPALDEADLSSLQAVLYGGSPIAPDLLRRAVQRLGCDFGQTYGMTETSVATYLVPADQDPDRKPHLLSSGGRAAISQQVRVVDEHDEDVAAGELGEVVVRGPQLFDGYWADPAATAEALRGGWMHTGDIGYFSDEGYLYIVDRLKDAIVSGGENVYSREVEDALYAHPDVLEAAVIAVPHERWGEAVHALVVARPPARPDAEELIAHCRERLAGYKVPKSIELVDELPKNALGKLEKKQLRDRYWSGRQRSIA
jgi:acyl-CoA synthetase (AMP-forming)/AMP-acid ligase II